MDGARPGPDLRATINTYPYPVTTGLFQPSHLLVLLVVVLVVFGPKRLPELGRSFGQGLRALKRGLDGHPDDADKPDGPGNKPDGSLAS